MKFKLNENVKSKQKMYTKYGNPSEGTSTLASLLIQ